MEPWIIASLITSASVTVLALTLITQTRWLARLSRQVAEIQYGLKPGTLTMRATPGQRPGGGRHETGRTTLGAADGQ
jgi:hypothetical protein